MPQEKFPGIIPDIVHEKIRQARRKQQPIYLYGAIGFGKTTLIKEYLSYRNYVYIAGNDFDEISSAEQQSLRSSSVVVIDDLHQIRREDLQAEILKLCEREDLWLILLSRAPVPNWLQACSVRKSMMVIPEEDLKLSTENVQKLCSYYDLSLSEELCERIRQQSEGNGFAVQSMALKLREGKSFDPEVIEETTRSFSAYLETHMIQNLEEEILEFLLQVSVVDEFNLELAEYITGNETVAAVIEKTQESGNFLFEADGIYRIRPQLLTALRSYIRKSYGTHYRNKACYNAGLYYETHGDLLHALQMYEQSNHPNRIRNILIRNSRRNPATGFYYEIRQYYKNLKEEEVADQPVLLSALSMLYSILLCPEESEYWYQKLKDFSRNAGGGAKKEAIARLAYLDIGLPHRGTAGLVEIVKHLAGSVLSRELVLPEFSVTSNLPSVMNGGKDFCNWSLKDKELAATIGLPLSMLLGKYGKGLVNEALGESFFEKGIDDFSVFTHLNKAHLEAETAGKVELLFAIVGIKTRMSLIHGDSRLAREHLDSFSKKITPREKTGMYLNLLAMYCRIDLYENRDDAIRQWMQTAPDENEEFFVLERYRYLTKIRCYIRSGEYTKAHSLLERLLYYAEQYHRPYLVMEGKLFLSIILRKIKAAWKELFIEMLETAYSYHFVRILSQEGIAVLPLLKEIKKEFLSDHEDCRKWFSQVLEETEKTARYYPAYLDPDSVTINDFGKNALEILSLQAEGLTVKQIAQRLGITEATVKYHTTETYKKLQVKSKTEAVQKARLLHIL